MAILVLITVAVVLFLVDGPLWIETCRNVQCDIIQSNINIYGAVLCSLLV